MSKKLPPVPLLEGGVPSPAERLLSPEERLLVAIFYRALRDYVFPERTTEANDIRSARRYFMFPRPWIFGSFGYFCLYFDLSSDELKKVIESDEMKERLKVLVGSH